MFAKSDVLILGAAFISFLFSVSLWFGVFGSVDKEAGLFVGCLRFWRRAFTSRPGWEPDSMSNLTIFGLGLFVTLFLAAGLFFTVWSSGTSTAILSSMSQNPLAKSR